MAAEQFVVGAALLRGAGRETEVLAAQRMSPAFLAGMWEFVGGKVEDGEDEIVALRRECREEIGVEIAVGVRVGSDVEITGRGLTLRVWTARISAGEPRPTEHHELRWLPMAELFGVPWLPADVPIVHELFTLLDGAT
ncbi:MAG: (deoxy)nucleoside triphosphate pyrophosphohydrolase [Actinomycetota bacterium]